MKKKIIIVLLVFVALFAITGCGKKSNKKENGRTIENYNNAFFIKEGTNFALFDDSGKKLTDFEFTYAGNFVNGTAIVKKDSNSGVINTSGKMVIPFGKYEYLYQEAGLYKVTDKERNNYLLNAKGEKITDLKDKTVITYIGESNYLILFDKNSNKYDVLDINGKSLVSFAKGKDDDKPSTNSAKNFVSVFYNNKNYIIDLVTGKKIIEFESDKHYCVNNASDDGKIITLNSCVGTFERQDEVKYKFIKDSKLYDLSDKCDKVSYNSENLICTKDNKNYLLDSKFNVGINLDGVSYTDNDHYAKAKSGSFNGIDFYEKGEVVTNVACRTMNDYGYSKSGFYILSTYYSKPCGTESGTYEYYNNKGENAFNKSFARAEKFDSNSLAVVSEDKTNYYLIDTKGNKVSEDYNRINFKNDYYIVTKNDLVGVLDNKGKLLLEAKYSNVDIFEQSGKRYFKLNDNNSKYIIYSVESKKEIVTFNSNPATNSNYITVKNKDGKTEYYTYNGKLFYTEK